MAAFLRKIFDLFAPTRVELNERVYLAAFGKHPAWDDHIDDIGLETDLLAHVKQLLYVDGIGGNIDSGGWDTLDQKGQAIPFQHLFVWKLPEAICIGRLSASRDGKGRTRYPLILCAHCARMSLDQALEEVAPRLDVLDRQCAAATSAASLRVVMNSTLHELRDQVSGLPVVSQVMRPGAVSMTALGKIADDPAMGPDHRGLLSVLYQIHREMADFSDDSTHEPSVPPQPLRVPRCAKDLAEAARLWLNFLAGRVSSETSVLLMLPMEEPWLDVIVGTPAASQLYCMRASLGTMPLTTQIPYTMEPQFVESANRTIESSRAAYGAGGADAPTRIVSAG